MRCAPLFGVFCNHLSVCVCAHADWNNFIERLTSGAHHLTVEDISGWIHEIAEAIQNTGEHDYRSSGERNKKRFVEELRLWASYRAQTLSRTVRGMLHAHATIKNRGATEDTKCTPEDANKLACAKYRLVVTCQVYEAMKAGKRGQAGKEQALDIELLMERHPELYVASVLTEGTRSFPCFTAGIQTNGSHAASSRSSSPATSSSARVSRRTRITQSFSRAGEQCSASI